MIEVARKIINDRMKLERLSGFYGSPVFKQKKENISEQEIEHFQRQLLEQGIVSSLDSSEDDFILKVLRAGGAQKPKRFITNIILFLLTFLTTLVTGSMLIGLNPFESWAQLFAGWPYSFALLTILLGHELGHYFAARYYGVQVTLPYFIPFFAPFFFHPGTMGAFIKMRSSIPHKKALFDIGIAGPLSSFILSIFFLVWGFSHLPDLQGIYDFIVQIHPLDNEDGLNLVLGNTLIFDWIAALFNGHRLPMNEIYHFHYIFAGWFGLLVTAINLMPIGQLDGGHITYAMFGDRARLIAFGAFFLLIILNVYLISHLNSYIWVLWILLILFFIRFRHPPTLDDSIVIDTKRKVLGYVSYVIFIVSFSPLPFHIY